MAKSKHEPQSQVAPDRNIPDMRRYLRKHYEGLANSRYSLRVNAWSACDTTKTSAHCASSQPILSARSKV